MKSNASRSHKQRASFVAAGAVVVVIAVLGSSQAAVAAAAEAVVKAPEATEMHCHDTGSEAPVAAATAMTAAPAGTPAAAVDGGPNPFADRFPNVVLKTHEGQTVRFYDDLLKGKIVVINFMYATCKGR